jgi:UDP-2,3-diacylglucosamine pyrophosphatase LpxH
MMAEKRHRAMFISDVHLGARGCQAALLIDFLRHNEADVVYLVGDIVDGWQLKFAAGTGRSRTTTSCRSCCARRARARAHHLRAGQS